MDRDSEPESDGTSGARECTLRTAEESTEDSSDESDQDDVETQDESVGEDARSEAGLEAEPTRNIVSSGETNSPRILDFNASNELLSCSESHRSESQNSGIYDRSDTAQEAPSFADPFVAERGRKTLIEGGLRKS